jgi:predicted  nucleic acid-binding Zn-ribbon protein
MAEKENDKRKLRAELDKARKDKNLLEQKMPNMDQSIGELQSMVDKMSKEIDKETKKRE